MLRLLLNHEAATAHSQFVTSLANLSKSAPKRTGFHASWDLNCSEAPICQIMTWSHCRNKTVGNGFVAKRRGAGSGKNAPQTARRTETVCRPVSYFKSGAQIIGSR